MLGREEDRRVRECEAGREEGVKVVMVEGKGRGVVATRPFSMKELVIPYAGDIVSCREGEVCFKLALSVLLSILMSTSILFNKNRLDSFFMHMYSPEEAPSVCPGGQGGGLCHVGHSPGHMVRRECFLDDFFISVDATAESALSGRLINHSNCPNLELKV